MSDSSQKSQNYGTIFNRERKNEPWPMNAFELEECLPDTAFPSIEYFINVLENTSLEVLSVKLKRKLADDIANLNVCLRCASRSWLLAFKQNKGFLKVEIFARAMSTSEFEPRMHSQLVQIAKTLINKKVKRQFKN